MNKNDFQRLAHAVSRKAEEYMADGQTEIITARKPVAPRAAQAAAGADTLESLRAKVEACRKCPLGEQRIKPVFGQGNPQAPIIFIGEGPGYEEDRQGLPFVGRSGQLLDKMLSAIQLDRTIVYIANVVKCHPMTDPAHPESRGNDRPPSPEEAECCLPYLKAQIALIKPKLMCVLGATALKYVLGVPEGISKYRGTFMEFEGIQTLITYHPAALLHNPALKVKSWADLQLLRDTYQRIK